MVMRRLVGWLKRRNAERRRTREFRKLSALYARPVHPSIEELLDRAFANIMTAPPLPEPEPCDGKHRPPAGPNEDIAVCPFCRMLTWEMRPEGEEIGGHIADCSLPRGHESVCVGGGEGHPPPRKMRG